MLPSQGQHIWRGELSLSALDNSWWNHCIPELELPFLPPHPLAHVLFLLEEKKQAQMILNACYLKEEAIIKCIILSPSSGPLSSLLSFYFNWCKQTITKTAVGKEINDFMWYFNRLFMYFFLSMFYLIISHFEEEMGNDQDQIHYIVLSNCKIKYESIRERFFLLIKINFLLIDLL